MFIRLYIFHWAANLPHDSAIKSFSSNYNWILHIFSELSEWGMRWMSTVDIGNWHKEWRHLQSQCHIPSKISSRKKWQQKEGNRYGCSFSNIRQSGIGDITLWRFEGFCVLCILQIHKKTFFRQINLTKSVKSKKCCQDLVASDRSDCLKWQSLSTLFRFVVWFDDFCDQWIGALHKILLQQFSYR